MAFVNNLEAVLNLVLSIAFVIRFGVAGVIAATVLAQALTNFWFLPGWAIRHLSLTPRAYFAGVIWPALPAALAGVASGLLLGHLFHSPAVALLSAVAAVAVLALVYYVLSGAEREEKALVTGMLRSRAA
jgi:peptidoglycan biosynthesis protein MviN/MurJ (putative lipid II flippase)